MRKTFVKNTPFPIHDILRYYAENGAHSDGQITPSVAIATGQYTLTTAIDDSMSKECSTAYDRNYLSGVVILTGQRADSDAAPRWQGAPHTGARDLRLDDLSRPSKQRPEREHLIGSRVWNNGGSHGSHLA
jgi:hypothetical protein